MLERLLNFIESPTHPNDAFVRLDSVRFEANDGILDVTVMDYNCVEEWARWRIRASELRECSIGRFGGELTLLSSDHVLIRQHTDPWQKLYFRGVPSSVLGTVGRMWVMHRQVVSDWIPFGRFLNSCVNLNDLLAAGYGLIGDGPAFLIEAYARVLSDDGLSPNIRGPYPAKWWNGTQWLANPPALVALELGESFCVASGFEEEELAREAG